MDAGYDLLAREGVSAIRLASLAASLGVTKGSFYWHFKDRGELLDAILEKWRVSCNAAIQAAVWRQPVPARQKLLWLWKLSFSGRPDNPGSQLESALKDWALTDPTVAALIAEVQQRRLTFLTSIYEQVGIAHPRSYAQLWYNYVIGFNSAAWTEGAGLDPEDKEIMQILLMKPR